MSRTLLLAAGLSLAIATPALARPFHILEPGLGAVLHSGDLVEVRWDSVPSGVEEMELLLSLDDGRHFAVRVTAELEAAKLSYSWRVPGFASRGVRLAMRMRLDDREVFGGASASFSIAARAGAEARPWSLRRSGGELWAVDGGCEVRSDDAGLREPAGFRPWLADPSFAPWVVGVATIDGRSSEGLPLTLGDARPRPDCAARRIASLAARTLPRAPLVIPLRT